MIDADLLEPRREIATADAIDGPCVQWGPALQQVTLGFDIGPRALARLSAALKIKLDQMPERVGGLGFDGLPSFENALAFSGVAHDAPSLDPGLLQRQPGHSSERHAVAGASGLIPNDPAAGPTL